ncbi:MAG: hypothetical protein BGO55_29455 [Sphingobacteriales bacterium 50-39]|nr:hypothetical protein [Sphingobacteriales bacterium]OJW60665.1 MAG: hypothetical protein BGO55_29455 [Sphingobacteriales bacterium 50-39]
MQKRKFTTPFWWMLVLGIIACTISTGILYFLVAKGYPMSWLTRLSLFYLPVIMFVEAVMYWTIRKRINYRRDAWNHLLLFTGAYVLNYIVRILLSALIILHSPAAMRMALYMRIANYGQLYLFWGLVIVAHVFFARVLIKAFAKPPVEEVVESGNLLDDVLD